MNTHNAQTCLEIPVPISMKNLVGTPPACLPTRGDHETIDILEALGTAFKAPKDEIIQAQNLAAGLSDILIILERPLHRRHHKFDVGFEEFVKSCNTLLAVDELIRFATNGARSIHTVTVLDAFSYQPDRDLPDETQKQCHEALAQILKAKKPRVLVRCHRDAYSNGWLKCIEQPGQEYRLKRKEIRITEDHTTVVLQSFHPSVAVNNADCRPEFRALLMYHFVAAFSELKSKFTLPETAEKIREHCCKPGEYRRGAVPYLKPWKAAHEISGQLLGIYRVPRRHGSEILPSKRRSLQAKSYDALFESLGDLFWNTKTCGGLAVAKTVLFLWKRHFQDDPLYGHIMSWLILSGNEQEDWLRSGKIPPLPCTWHKQFPDLQEISSMTSTKDDIKSIMKDTVALLTEASETLGQGRQLEGEFCTRIVNALEKHNKLCRRYLGESSMSDIKSAMRISNLLFHCEILLSAVRDEAFTLKEEECVQILSRFKSVEGLFGLTLQE